MSTIGNAHSGGWVFFVMEQLVWWFGLRCPFWQHRWASHPILPHCPPFNLWEVLMPLATVAQLLVAYCLGLFFFEEKARFDVIEVLSVLPLLLFLFVLFVARSLDGTTWVCSWRLWVWWASAYLGCNSSSIFFMSPRLFPCKWHVQ